MQKMVTMWANIKSPANISFQRDIYKYIPFHLSTSLKDIRSYTAGVCKLFLRQVRQHIFQALQAMWSFLQLHGCSSAVVTDKMWVNEHDRDPAKPHRQAKRQDGFSAQAVIWQHPSKVVTLKSCCWGCDTHRCDTCGNNSKKEGEGEGYMLDQFLYFSTIK